jgi:hypothetical protein
MSQRGKGRGKGGRGGAGGGAGTRATPASPVKLQQEKEKEKEHGKGKGKEKVAVDGGLVKEAGAIKEKGNEAFNSGNLAEALILYSRAIDLLLPHSRSPPSFPFLNFSHFRCRHDLMNN